MECLPPSLSAFQDTYLIYNEKSHLLLRAVHENPFHSTLFLWVDIGCFRNARKMPLFQHWPDPHRLAALSLPGNRIVVNALSDFRSMKWKCRKPDRELCLGPVFSNMHTIAGGIFGCEGERYYKGGAIPIG